MKNILNSMRPLTRGEDSNKELSPCMNENHNTDGASTAVWQASGFGEFGALRVAFLHPVFAESICLFVNFTISRFGAVKGESSALAL